MLPVGSEQLKQAKVTKSYQEQVTKCDADCKLYAGVNAPADTGLNQGNESRPDQQSQGQSQNNPF